MTVSGMNGVMGDLEKRFEELKKKILRLEMEREALLLKNEQQAVELDRALFIVDFEEIRNVGFDPRWVSQDMLKEITNEVREGTTEWFQQAILEACIRRHIRRLE